MKKKFILSLVSFMFFSLADSKIPVNLLPSESEAKAMLTEADDFIDSFPEGYQDRMANAVSHAARGMTGELDKIRKNTSTTGTVSKNVTISDFYGKDSSLNHALRLYRPLDCSTPLPLLIFIHGGGWCLGNVATSSEFCSQVAASGKAMVLAADYSLSPENKFPAGIDDCCRAINFAVSNMEKWNVKSLNLCGDGAGANIALAAVLSSEDSDKDFFKLIKSIILFDPVVKISPEKTASWKKYSRGYGLDSRLMEAFSTTYISSADTSLNMTDPSISPFFANERSLKKLPPVLIINSERDILFDQGVEFSKKLDSIGVEVDNVVFPGTVHSFVSAQGQPTALAKAVQLTEYFLSSEI